MLQNELPSTLVIVNFWVISHFFTITSSLLSSSRPVGRGVAGVARATPTFDENRVKSIVVPPQLFGEKRHKAHQILVPPHLKIPTYGPVYLRIFLPMLCLF